MYWWAPITTCEGSHVNRVLRSVRLYKSGISRDVQGVAKSVIDRALHGYEDAAHTRFNENLLAKRGYPIFGTIQSLPSFLILKPITISKGPLQMPFGYVRTLTHAIDSSVQARLLRTIQSSS